MIRAEQILEELIDKNSCDIYIDIKSDVDKAMKQITWEGWIALIKIVVGPKADIALIEKEYREKFNQWYEGEVK